MKKTGLLFFIGLILTINVYAKRLQGELLLEHDTLKVTFKIPVSLFSKEINYEKLQRKIQYFDSIDNKVVLKPEYAREIRFNYRDEEIRMLSRLSPQRLHDLFSKNHYFFLKLETDGRLKLFRYYYTENSPEVYDASGEIISGGYSYSADKYILQKLNEDLYIPKILSFRKDMMKYFQDCPELSHKIETREYRKRDMVNIVRYYNSACMN
jgi:hypothetical protein